MNWPMNWLRRLLGRQPRLAPEQAGALSTYFAISAPDLDLPADRQRLVVVDVETSGLDPSRDRLLAIGAVAVGRGVIHFEDSFEVVLRQDAPSANDNILVHGIDGTTQCSGTDTAEALLRFLDYAGKSPLVGFHSDFDRIAIERATREALGAGPANAWLDLATAAPAVFPEHAGRTRTLDDWARLFGIENHARHNALADAFATAQLLLVVMARAAADGDRRLSDLITASTAQRWLAR
jgi:DNA polymerase-3 subunit epsilon